MAPSLDFSRWWAKGNTSKGNPVVATMENSNYSLLEIKVFFVSQNQPEKTHLPLNLTKKLTEVTVGLVVQAKLKLKDQSVEENVSDNGSEDKIQKRMRREDVREK
ncbi:hypothetical protein L3X38_043376 [Prunus dulcis]|uniref:Uncharacterized protein n=1 Tax=Prunus dulcis TaxID=3755 RepID=A0AAD4YM72_PRUDU|nr:hypothetical protein L3X38_043376 [Prunus dulcis]